jgi:hypothetical protein
MMSRGEVEARLDFDGLIDAQHVPERDAILGAMPRMRRRRGR